MSFYLGKDSNGTSVMAVSKTAESAATLKDAVNFHNLAYHSKYQYTNVDIYTTTVSTFGGKLGVSYFRGYAPPSIFKVNGIPRMFLMYIVGNPVPVTCQLNIEHVHKNPETTLNFNVAFPGYCYADDTFLVTVPQGGLQTLSLEFLLFDIDYSGNLLVPTSSNGISMDSSGITVKGENYFTTKWLVSPAINNVDRIITLFGKTAQIINSVPTTGAVELSVNSEKTIIKHGGKVVLDSTANYCPMIYNQNARSFEVSNQFFLYISGGSAIFRTGLPTSDSIAVLMFHGVFNPYNNPYTAIKYNIPIMYNPAYDTGFIPIVPSNGYPGEGGQSICFGTLLLRIHNGTASIKFSHHYCTQGAPVASSGIYQGPYYVASTHVIY